MAFSIGMTFMRKKLALPTVGALLMHAAMTLGQTSGTAVPTPTAPASSFDRKLDNRADLLSAGLPVMADTGLQLQVDREMASMANDLAQRRQWLGHQGLLLQVRVVRRNVEPGLPAEVRLLQIVDHGVGNTPLDTLTRDMARNRVLLGVPDGFRLSPEHRYFVWITATGEPREFRHPMSDALHDRAIEANANTVLSQTTDQNDQIDRLRAIEAALATDNPRLEGQAAARRLAAGARQSREELIRINAELAQALERERRAAAGLEWLRSLRQATELGVQIAGIAERLGADAPPSPLSIPDKGALEEYVSTVRVRAGRDRAVIEQRQVVIKRDGDRQVIELYDNLRTWNVPSDMLPRP